MRKILTILLTIVSLGLFGQDIKPISPNFKLLQSPSFSYYTIDSSVWIYKGAIDGWTKLASARNVKNNKVTSLQVTGTTLKTITLNQTYGGTVTTTFTDESGVGTIQAPTLNGFTLGLTDTSTTVSLPSEVTQFKSTGASINQVATANGSSGMQFQSLKTVNSNSLFGTGNVAVGDVFKVGTPSNKQLGVWTGDGTIQGVSGLTFGESQTGLKIPYPDGFSRIRLDDPSNPFDVTNFSSYTSLQYPYGSAALNIYNSGAIEMPNLANSSQSHILYYNPSNGLITYSTNTGGSSQWNNDTYGINYTAGRIGIGSVSNNYAKLNIEASTNDYYGAQIFSYSTALSLRGNGSLGAPVFEVRDGSSNDRFHINADGSIYASTGLGSAITSYNLYFNTSTGQITYGAAGSGGGMTDPMTTAGDIIIRNGSNITSRLGIGSTGQILTVSGGIPSWQNAPSGTSQWTTDTYGINYTNNVGIGNASSNVAGLAVYKNIDTGYAGYFSNTSSSAFGVSVRVGSSGSQPILSLLGNTSTQRFDFKSDGSMYAYSLQNVDQSYVLGYNNSTGQITYLPKPSGGGGSGTVTSFSSGNLSPLFTTSVANATTTPALSFSAVSQAQNLVYASPNGSSGTPTFRKVVVGDISASGTPSSSTYLDGSGTWSTPVGLPNAGVWGTTPLADGSLRTQSIGAHTINKVVELYYTIKRNNVMYGHGKVIFYTYYDGTTINVTKDETQSSPGSGITIDMTTSLSNYGLQITNNSGASITMSASYVYLVNTN